MFGRNSFEQRLLLNDGYFKYTGKDYTIAKIWVDIFNPVVHVDMNGLEKIIVQVAYGNWHYEDRPIIKQERDQGSWGIYTSKIANDTDVAFFLDQIGNTGPSNVFEYNARWYDDEANTPRPDLFPDGELWNVWLNHMQDTANEVPWLYTVFPWPEYGLGLPNLTHAINAYLYDAKTFEYHGNTGWKQDSMWPARTGLTANGTAMTEAQYAPSKLIQTFVGNDIRLPTAWPKTWDGRFKVKAPQNTTIEGTVETGKMQILAVLPKSRTQDVIIEWNH
ncbi:hypothetical protein ACHAPA_011719 [Fusarium lateritium]